MLIVVKVGSQTLTQNDGSLDLNQVRSLLTQIVTLNSLNYKVLLVSSGAVAIGQHLFKSQQSSFQDKTEKRQVLSSVGQAYLIYQYNLILSECNYLASQILLRKEDFESPSACHNMTKLFEALFKSDRILPIVNENDSTALEERMFVDNDDLASTLASTIKAERLIILTGVDGVYDRPPHQENAKVMDVWDVDSCSLPQTFGDKSLSGRGGIESKIASCTKAVHSGILTCVANAREPDVLVRLIHSLEPIGTCFRKNKASTGG
jgi:glutamate 5-kinase